MSEEHIESQEQPRLGRPEKYCKSGAAPGMPKDEGASALFGDCLVTISVVVYVTGCGGLCLRTQVNRILRRFLLLRRSGLMSSGLCALKVDVCLV
jgi:hypothetical protein